jgi:hypothetical protein
MSGRGRAPFVVLRDRRHLRFEKDQENFGEGARPREADPAA